MAFEEDRKEEEENNTIQYNTIQYNIISLHYLFREIKRKTRRRKRRTGTKNKTKMIIDAKDNIFNDWHWYRSPEHSISTREETIHLHSDQFTNVLFIYVCPSVACQRQQMPKMCTRFGFVQRKSVHILTTCVPFWLTLMVKTTMKLTAKLMTTALVTKIRIGWSATTTKRKEGQGNKGHSVWRRRGDKREATAIQITQPQPPNNWPTQPSLFL